MDICGFRRGQLAGNCFLASQDFNGANQSGAMTECPQQRVQKIRGGGLAVGAREPEQLQ